MIIIQTQKVIQKQVSSTGYLPKAKEPHLSNYLPLVEGKKRLIQDFPKGISIKGNKKQPHPVAILNTNMFTVSNIPLKC